MCLGGAGANGGKPVTVAMQRGIRAVLAQVGAALVQRPLYRKIGGDRKRPGERKEAGDAPAGLKTPSG